MNQRGLDYYRALVDGLLGRGIVPVATVYHWELPQELEDVGGWAARDTAARFAEYARLLAEALGDRVGMWITMNEPQQVAHQGYRVGTHAPGRTDLGLAAAATHHLLLGHGLAMEAMRACCPAESRSASRSTSTRSGRPARTRSTRRRPSTPRRTGSSSSRSCTGRYPDAARAQLLPSPALIEPGDMRTICAPIDFLGLNYYCPHYVRIGDSDDLRVGESPLAGSSGRGELPAARGSREPSWAG